MTERLVDTEELLDPLPNTLSELLSLAVTDAMRAEKSSKYELDMTYWHAPLPPIPFTADNPEKRCRVCMAGAVIAFTMKKPADRPYIPEMFSDPIADKLSAINLMRRGLFNLALSKLSNGTRTLPPLLYQKLNDAVWDDFDHGLQHASWDTYLKQAKRLKEAGY